MVNNEPEMVRGKLSGEKAFDLKLEGREADFQVFFVLFHFCLLPSDIGWNLHSK